MGDYIIVDGQDATTLIGTIDVFRESNAILFLKNSYLKNFDLYRLLINQMTSERI